MQEGEHEMKMKLSLKGRVGALSAVAGVVLSVGMAAAYAQDRGQTSYSPVAGTEPFASVMNRLKELPR